MGPLSCLSVCNVGVLWPNGWMDKELKMPLGTEVGPGEIVLDGDQAPPRKGTQQFPHFSALFAQLWHGHLSQQLLSSCSFISTEFRHYGHIHAHYRVIL